MFANLLCQPSNPFLLSYYHLSAIVENLPNNNTDHIFLTCVNTYSQPSLSLSDNQACHNRTVGKGLQIYHSFGVGLWLKYVMILVIVALFLFHNELCLVKPGLLLHNNVAHSPPLPHLYLFVPVPGVVDVVYQLGESTLVESSYLFNKYNIFIHHSKVLIFIHEMKKATRLLLQLRWLLLQQPLQQSSELNPDSLYEIGPKNVGEILDYRYSRLLNNRFLFLITTVFIR